MNHPIDRRQAIKSVAVTGVSQVTVMGGQMKQYQVLTSPERLSRHDVTLDELTRAVEKSNIVTGGGFLLSKNEEALIRIVGRANTPEQGLTVTTEPVSYGPSRNPWNTARILSLTCGSSGP